MPDAAPPPPTPAEPERDETLPKPRDVRRLAMQALYTLDVGTKPITEPAGDDAIRTAGEARARLQRQARDEARNEAQASKASPTSEPSPPPPSEPKPVAAPDPEALLEALEEPIDDGEADANVASKALAVELALAAWADRERADEQCSQLAPEWPTHRQPPIDRAILRLAWHEMTAGRTEPALAINEALELAKQFSDEKSPAFLNGVLDRVAVRLPNPGGTPRNPSDAANAPHPKTGDAWLDDATAG